MQTGAGLTLQRLLSSQGWSRARRCAASSECALQGKAWRLSCKGSSWQCSSPWKCCISHCPNSCGLGLGPWGHAVPAPPPPFLKLIQLDWDMLQLLGASLACLAASTIPCSHPVPIPFYGPMPGEEGGQASLEASTLPSTSSSSDEMDMTTTGAALRTPWRVAKALAGQASTVVSPGLVTVFPATDPRPELCRGAHVWALHGGFVAPAPGAL